jgi:hypothetical protein
MSYCSIFLVAGKWVHGSVSYCIKMVPKVFLYKLYSAKKHYSVSECCRDCKPWLVCWTINVLVTSIQKPFVAKICSFATKFRKNNLTEKKEGFCVEKNVSQSSFCVALTKLWSEGASVRLKPNFFIYLVKPEPNLDLSSSFVLTF